MSETISPPVIAGAEFHVPEAALAADADAATEVAAAFDRARQTGKRVLLVLGGDWCPDFRTMIGIFRLPVVAAFRDRHFETVFVNIGRYDANMDIPAAHGLPAFDGVPTLMVLDAVGTLLNASEPSVLRNVRDRDPQDIADYLAKYAG